MEAAFAWINAIAEWVGQFVPRILILDTTMGAVKFVRGKKAVALAPGLHLYWPLTTTVHTYPIARQADDLRSQTVVTSDDKVVVVGGLIVYEVDDILKLVGATFRPQDTIKDISLTAIHDVVCQLGWEDLKAQQRSGALDRKLRSETAAALKTYGVKVLKVQLTDLAPTRVIKVMQSTQADAD